MRFALILLVPTEGLEPPTFPSVAERSIQLSYAGKILGISPECHVWGLGDVPNPYVGMTGFEPALSCTQNRRFPKLSYIPRNKKGREGFPCSPRDLEDLNT